MMIGEGNAPPGKGTDSGDPQLLRRFSAGQDEEAFAELVRRHGPMVLGVCQRVLGDRHEAEDAFQVTFLVLACKAGSLSRPELLANWLYGVAYRTASKARARALRRRESERRAASTQTAGPMREEAGRELRAVLDDELSRLPEKYRAPLVLCYLGGQTNQEAARLLGRPAGSMSRLLLKARTLLRARLSRHGFAFDLRFCARLLAEHELPVPEVPGELVESTAKAAALFAAGRSGPARLPVWAAELTEEVLGALAEGLPRRGWRWWWPWA